MAEVCMNLISKNKGYSAPILDYRDPFRENKKRKLPEMKKNFQLSEVHEIHHEIARQLVIGIKPKKIAENLKVSYQSVLNVKNSPIIQEHMKILGGARDAETHDVAKQIRDLAPKCVEVLENILEDDEVGKSLKMKTSLAILDRSGHAVPKNVNVKSLHAVISSRDLEAIKERAAEIGMTEDSEVIDV